MPHFVLCDEPEELTLIAIIMISSTTMAVSGFTSS